MELLFTGPTAHDSDKRRDNGGSSRSPRPVTCCRHSCRTCANSDLLASGVTRIVYAAVWSDARFMLMAATSHWPTMMAGSGDKPMAKVAP